VEKYSRAGPATDDNTAHAHCTLDTEGYKHTLTTCNSYCFSTATEVAQTHLRVTLHVNCLSVTVMYICWYMYERYVKYDLQFSL